MQEESAVRISGISCCSKKSPVGVFGRPTFFFDLEASPNFTYTGCQIQVASDYNLLANGTPDVWDSGTIRGEMHPVKYQGNGLLPFRRYFWRVKAVGAGNEVSEFSEIGEFVTGAVRRSDWGAAVFSSGISGVSSVAKAFTADDTPESAFLFVACSGGKGNSAAAYINGNKAGCDGVFPGPAESFAMYVFGADVTEYIRRRNSVRIDFRGRLSVVLKLNYSDGRSETVESGDGWTLLKDTPYIMTDDVGRFEEYDASKASVGFSPDLPDGDISPEKGGSPMYYRQWLCGATTGEGVSPAAIKPCESGWLFDFGKVINGFAEIALHDCREAVVVRYAARADEDFGKSPCCVYHPSGRAAEKYRPTFMSAMFRYVLVEGLSYRPGLSDAVAFSVTSAPKKAEFFCSDEDLNGLFLCAADTFSMNAMNLPTERPDGNGSGKPGYTLAADAQLLINDAEGAYRRLLENMADSQSSDGYIPAEFPDISGKTDIVASMSAVGAVWSLYIYTGDKKLLSVFLPSAKALMNALSEASDGGYSFSRTLLEDADKDGEEPADSGYLASAFYFKTAEIMSLWCAALHDRDGADGYRELAIAVGNAINEKYLRFTAGRYFYDKCTQCANTLALAFGFCPEKVRSSVTEALVDDIKLKDRLTVGHIANTYIFSVLADNGYADLAYSLIKSDAAVRASFPGRYAKWLVGSFIGLSFETPGGKRIRIKPFMPEEIEEASFETSSLYGNISVYWRRDEGKISIDIEVPIECEAVLCLPVNNSRLGNRDVGEQFVFRTGKHHITINDRSTKSQ